MAPRFVRQDRNYTTLPISQGDTLTVRRRLTAGERRQQRGMATFQGLADVSVILAYLLDWTIKDDKDALVPIEGKPTKEIVDILDALDPETYDEINAAIKAHVAAMDQERADEKNAQTGEVAPQTSSLLAAVAGPST